MFRELHYYSRMAAGIVHLMRQPLPSDPEEFVRERLRNRETTFLQFVERVIFGTPGHPFHRMFDAAGCAFGDLAGEVRRTGLEDTLLALRRQGVYVSHDEWKGKVPIVRNGREIPATTNSFKNPLVTGWLEGSSSGSTGRPVPSVRSTALLIQSAVYQMLRARECGERCVWIDLKPILPYFGGLNSTLRGRRTGTPVERWFTAGSAFLDHGHYLLATRSLVTLGNLFGAAAPYPEYLPHNDFSPVAEYIARRRADGRIPVLHGFASPLVRVASTAIEKDVDISGAIFICGGEALSPAKLALFDRAGVRTLSSYTVSEIGNLGFGCTNMRGSCVHIFEDSVAAIRFPKTVPYADDAGMNSLHFTTLAPHAPNILINLELDDDGVIERATCDCVYSRIGLTRRINHINSFGKTNPHGITFHRTDLAEVLERDLPERLGGGPGDYQAVECEAQNGQTQLRLHVSPRLGITDCGRIRDAFLEVMRRRWDGALATREWANSDTVEVMILEPIATRTGKVHPVRVLGAYSSIHESGQGATNAPS
jgi:hypothetical protein